VNFGRRKSQFVGIGRPGGEYPHQYVLHFVIVAQQLQQRLMPGARLADSEEIFCRRVNRLDQKVAVNYDNGCIETVEDKSRARWLAPAFRLLWIGLLRFVRPYRAIEFCCT
jgi:hypothetical protein